jgi:hypothetical protein
MPHLGLLVLTIHIAQTPSYRRPGWTQGPGGVILTPLLQAFPGPQLFVGRAFAGEYTNPRLSLKQLAARIGADVYTHTSQQESEREAARAVERAIYADLFPIGSSIENGNKTAGAN